MRFCISISGKESWGYGKKFGIARLQPSRFAKWLAFGAMSITTRIIGRVFVTAKVAFVQMPAKFGCPASPNIVYYLQVRFGQRMTFAVSVGMHSENIRNFRFWFVRTVSSFGSRKGYHDFDRLSLSTSDISIRSRGLFTASMSFLATWR